MKNPNGLFAKSEEIIEKIPLQSIRIVNGKLQISKVDDDENGLGLQILLQNGERVHFVFEKKKELQIWYDTIFETITGKKIENNTTSKKSIKKENSMIGGFLGVVQNIKDIAKDQIDEVKDIFNDNEEVDNTSDHKVGENQEKEENQEEIENNKLSNNEEENAKEIMNSEEKKYMYCNNCGEKIMPNSKFCNYCGTQVNKEEKDNSKNEEKFEKDTKDEQVTIENDLTERKTVYEGKIHKCPNCGEILKSFEIKCPYCGFEIRNNQSSSSVQEFTKKLEKLEEQRGEEKNPRADNITKTDKKKINLIRSYAIPNNKEDIFEFIILAASNVDSSVYGMGDDGLPHATKAISDAWLAKMEQAYQKAALSFSKEPDFENIKEIYRKTTNSIAKKEKQEVISNVGSMIIIAIIGIVSFGVLIYMNISSKNTDSKNSTLDNNSISSQVDNSQTIGKAEENTKNDFNEKQIIENLKITEYKYTEYGMTTTAFIIKNESDFTLNISANFKFYDQNGNLVGARDRSNKAVEKGTETLMCLVTDTDYDEMKYEISAEEDDYYKPIVNDLQYETSKGNNKEILTLTNNSDLTGKSLKVYALFFKNNNLVGCTYEYMSDDNGVLKPKKSLTKEFTCYEEYDSVKFYCEGFGE